MYTWWSFNGIFSLCLQNFVVFKIYFPLGRLGGIKHRARKIGIQHFQAHDPNIYEISESHMAVCCLATYTFVIVWCLFIHSIPLPVNGQSDLNVDVEAYTSNKLRLEIRAGEIPSVNGMEFWANRIRRWKNCSASSSLHINKFPEGKYNETAYVVFSTLFQLGVQSENTDELLIACVELRSPSTQRLRPRSSSPRRLSNKLIEADRRLK